VCPFTVQLNFVSLSTAPYICSASAIPTSLF
jgi:hypothetical protein